jgi:hypothetical protein
MALTPAVLALAAVPHLAAARADRPPVLDGKLDDPVWQRAPTSDAFTQKRPVDGLPASDRTIVRVLYDDDALYVGIDCPQGVPVVARLTRRDRWVEADRVAVVLDTRGDGKSAFQFQVNAAGVLSDGLRFDDTEWNGDWDENWEAATSVRSDGWSAELRIPLRALRFPALPVQSWGLQVRRYVSDRHELDEWAHIPRELAGEVSHYGRLDDLHGLKSKSSVELRPFIVGLVRHYDAGATTLARGWAPSGSLGLDLKWHVNQALTLDATILPDFGQVEADQVILNLTKYEIQFPEKRPFFLEGFDVFQTPIQLLYTRRIGRAPDAPELLGWYPSAPASPSGRPGALGAAVLGEGLVQAPQPSTILGAAKLSGDLGGRWTVGELVALTERQTVTVQPPLGPAVDRMVDPYTAFTMLRLKRDLGQNAHVGFMFTGVERLEGANDYPVAPGSSPTQLQCPQSDVAVTVAPGARCFHDAYVAGVDGRWRSAGGDYTVSGQAVGSVISNGPPRTLPDGTVIKSGDTGPAVSVRAAKEGGSSYVGVADLEVYGRRVDFNDLGFMYRQNLVKPHAAFEYRTLKPKGETLETHTSIDFQEQDNLDGQNQYRALAIENFTRYKNFWVSDAIVRVQPRHWDDREMGDGAALQRGGLVGFELWARTDLAKRVSGALWTQTNLIENGVSFQGDGRLSLKIVPQWDVDLLPNWIYTRGEPRYFGVQNQRYLFGRQRAQSASLTLRSTYTFMPRLTLQAYLQAIVEAEHYTDATSTRVGGAGTTVHLTDLRPVTFPLSSNPDFGSGTINATIVARWEYLLGSTLFVVYTHAQSNQVTPGWGGAGSFDFNTVRPRAAEEDLLLKLSYWWGG